MATELRDKMMDKVRKLLALSNSTNVHEASVAAAAAQRLMLEYQIEQIELEGLDADGGVEQHIDKESGEYYSMPKWHGILMNQICVANNCRLILTGRHEGYNWDTGRKKRMKQSMCVVGAEGDRAAAKYMFVMLMSEIERQAVRASQRGEIAGKSGHASFKLGAACAIGTKLVEAHKASKAQAMVEHGVALAVIDKKKAAVDDFFKSTFTNVQKSRSSARANDRSAYEAGRRAGESINTGQKAVGENRKALN